VNRIIFISSLFLLLGLGACEKLNKKKEYVLNAEFTEYFKFGAQSTWNYSETTGGSTVATIEVVGPQEGIMDLGEVKQEFFSYDLNAIGVKDMLIRAVADQDKISRLSLFVNDTTHKVIAELFYLDGVFKSYSGRNDLLVNHPSKDINGKTYSNVIEMQLNGNPYYTKIYFAKKVGIIALEEKSSRELLLSSYIIK